MQEELARRAGMAGDKSKFSARYWFSGKIRCGACGRTFAVKRTARAGDREYQRFVCRGRYDGSVRCQMHSVRGEVILACAQRVLQELALDIDRIVSELLRLQEQLAQAEKQRAELERGEGRFDEIRSLLERELAGGENVLDEVIRRIIVYEDYFIIEVAELPVSFRIRAEGSGAGKDFKAVSTECVSVANAANT